MGGGGVKNDIYVKKEKKKEKEAKQKTHTQTNKQMSKFINNLYWFVVCFIIL